MCQRSILCRHTRLSAFSRMAVVEEGDRQRDKLSLRVRKEGKVTTNPNRLRNFVEKDEYTDEVSVQKPWPPTTCHERSCAVSDNR